MFTTESGFSEIIYFDAALERIGLANRLFEAKPTEYVVVSYLAGVAVESMLRAYGMRAGKPFDARHNLAVMAESYGFYIGMKQKERENSFTLIGEVTSRWRNDYRYRSASALRDFVVAKGLYRIIGTITTRVDVVEFNTIQLIEASRELIGIGAARWQR